MAARLKITGLELGRPARPVPAVHRGKRAGKRNRSAGRPPADACAAAARRMDYVICNPPYFDRNAGANAPTAEKRTARQDATCSVEELAVAASFVLHTGGKAAFVFRPERLWVLLEALSRVRLVPKRMRFVHQSVQAAPSVVMVECRKGGSAEGLVVEPPLIVESDEYFRIYGIEH
ncbi:MAG: hypothetical protein ACLT4C_02690 [Butyricicoccus sp.]